MTLNWYLLPISCTAIPKVQKVSIWFMQKLAECAIFEDVQVVIDDYIDYYNNRRYQWDLAKLSPNEYYRFVTTGEYPLNVPNVPALPTIQREPSQLGIQAVASNATSN